VDRSFEELNFEEEDWVILGLDSLHMMDDNY
jgi:hypothetical protein